MQNSFTEFYTDKKILLASSLLAAAVAVLTGVLGAVNGDSVVNMISFAFIAICMVILCISYFKHDKNVMKGMIGVAFTWAIMTELGQVAGLFGEYKSSYDASGILGRIYLTVEIVFAVLMFVAFFTHFIINSDHHSSPKMVLFNQIAIVVLMFVAVLQLSLAAAIVGSINNGQNLVYVICTYITDVFLLSTIICIESQLDARRIQREANGWTEKK